MPITEIIRVIATAPGQLDGRPVRVDLAVDVDGRFGCDEDAFGYPAFWLRVDGQAPDGPHEFEDEALAAAAARYGAVFY
jgi:hypothetical protein